MPGLRPFKNNPDVHAIVVVIDADNKDCASFLTELQDVALRCGAERKTLFRLAIEEIEAWYLGDNCALKKAYPSAKPKVLATYRQDSVCGTWELLADAIFPGGRKALKDRGGPNAGDLKHEWARSIGPLMDVASNASPSFVKFRDGLMRVASPCAP